MSASNRNGVFYQSGRKIQQPYMTAEIDTSSKQSPLLINGQKVSLDGSVGDCLNRVHKLKEGQL